MQIIRFIICMGLLMKKLITWMRIQNNHNSIVCDNDLDD